MSRLLKLGFVVTFAFIPQAHVFAQTAYPNKPIRYVVPYPPGGSADTLGRVVAQKLGQALGQRVVVENRAGATGTIGADNVAKSPPDGYSILLHTSSYTTNAAVQTNLPFDPLQDLIALGMISRGALALVIHPSVPAKTVKEFVALARAKPNQLAFSSAGSASIQRFATELFMKQTKTVMLHVPYKGIAPAVTDLVAGQVQVLIGSISGVRSQVDAKRLRVLAVTGPKQTSLMPGVATMIENGLPNYSVELWWGLFLPGKTPVAIVSKLNAELQKILTDNETRQQILLHGAEAAPMSAADFQKIVATDIRNWKAIALEQGIKE